MQASSFRACHATLCPFLPILQHPDHVDMWYLIYIHIYPHSFRPTFKWSTHIGMSKKMAASTQNDAESLCSSVFIRWAFCTKYLVWLFCFYFNFNYFCLGKLWLFIILKLVKLAQCWKNLAAIVVQLSFQFISLHMLVLILENSINFICSWWNPS